MTSTASRFSDARAATLQRLAYLDLGAAIDVGGVDHGDAEIERAVDERDGCPVVAHAAGVDVGDPDAHRAEADGGHLRPLTAELTSFHDRRV